MTTAQQNLQNRADSLVSRISRNEQWLERLRVDAEALMREFANAVGISDNARTTTIGKQYAEKCKTIAHVKLIVVQARIERSRLVNTLTQKTY